MSKAHKYNQGPDVVESGNYNTAKIYAGLKIAKHIIDIDVYKTICFFGSSEIIDELTINDEMKTRAKLSALHRILKTTQMIIDNTLFVFDKRPEDKKTLEEYREALDKLEGVFPMCKKEIVREGYNGRSTTLHINQKVYDSLLQILVGINTEILTPLNNADLIFVSIEDFDPDKYKDDMMKKFMGEG